MSICPIRFRVAIRCSWRRQTLPPVPPPGDFDQTTLTDVWLVLPPGEQDKTRGIFDSHLLCEKTRHPQNRKYKTYCTAISRGPSHDHREHVQKIWWNPDMSFLRREQTDRHADCNISHHCRRQSNKRKIYYGCQSCKASYRVDRNENSCGKRFCMRNAILLQMTELALVECRANLQPTRQLQFNTHL